MKINKKMIKIIFSVFFLPLLTVTCDLMVGLGEMISTKGPTLSIRGPAAEEGQSDIQVSNLFVLSGTTTGPSAASRMSIQLTRFDTVSNTLVVLGREWEYNKGWKWREDFDASLLPYTEDSYREAGDITNISPPSWLVSENDVTWSLPINLDIYQKGDFFISVRTWDAAGNTDSDSVKKIKVVYDNDEPYLIITNLSSLHPGTGPQMNPELPEDEKGNDLFGGYVYDPVNNPEITYDFLEKNSWINEYLEFGWSIDKEIIGNYRLVIEITNGHDLKTGQGKELYYRYTWEGDLLPRYGMFRGTDDDNNENIPSGYTGYTKIGNRIPVSELVPRDLETGLPNGKDLNVDKYTPMMIVVWLEDGNGIKDSVPHKGWFPLWEKTNKPFAHINFGYKEEPGIPAPSYAPEQVVLWSTQSNNVIAYDNTGVKSLEWQIRKLKDDSLDYVNSDDNFTYPVTGVFDLNLSSKDDSKSIEIAPYGVGRFKLTVIITDENDVKGDEYSVYFTIDSNITPTVKEILLPDDTQTLFGNETGDFKIKGVAQIEDEYNTLKIDKISVAWINPAVGNAKYVENTLKYTDRNYENWNGIISGGEKYFQDSEGNRVWEVTNISGEVRHDNSNMEEYTFEIGLNIFNDLNIKQGYNPSRAQTFLVRVFCSDNTRASVRRIDTIGDNSAPNIEVTEIIVKNQSNVSRSYKRGQNGFDMISTINQGDSIRLKGTWTDDSLIKWSGLSSDVLEKYFYNFYVSWNGEELDLTNEELNPVLFTDVDANGRADWETHEYFFTGGKNNDAIVTLTASITDHNNNVGKDDITIIIETDNPTLVRITSDTGDGQYGVLKDTYPLIPGSRFIDIFLEFNKHVQFFVNTGDHSYLPPDPQNNAPYLLLSNGGKAYYYEGNGETRFAFRYFVNGIVDTSFLGYTPSNISNSGGSSTDKLINNGRLNVTEIIWPGIYKVEDCKSVDGGTRVNISQEAVLEGSYSLKSGKNIVIDKEAPKLTSIITTAGARPHGTGSHIYITANFDETVQVPSLDAGSASFYLNLGLGGISQAQARFDSVTGASSVTFLYTVAAGHDTSATNEYLRILSLFLSSGLEIKDTAGNLFNVTQANTALPNAGVLQRRNTEGNLTPANLRIDTVAPNVPRIESAQIESNKTYYENIKFNITGLESPDVSVEYCINYNPAAPASALWTGVPSSYAIQGSTKDNYYITGIPIELNGTYNIAARQRDNATTPNVSANPQTANILQNVKIDKEPLISRIGSSTPDGIYGYGNGNTFIDIEVVFRIPINLQSQAIPGTPNPATLTMTGVTTNSAPFTSNNPVAELSGVSSDKKTFTFRFRVENNHLTNRLDVAANGLNLGSLRLYDDNGTELNKWINLNDIPVINGYMLQKKIMLLTGNPTAVNIITEQEAIYITFDRDIYKGDTQNKLLITQIAGVDGTSGYRIPSVMTEARWSELFVGRSDIGIFNETQWRQLGEQLYFRGSNGAKEGTGNSLDPDTTVKRVLNFDIETRDNVTGTNIVTGTSSTYNNVRAGLRIAERLSYHTLDNEVSIISIDVNGELKPRILRISLAAPKPLPVKGASYEWNIPNGFVKDFLEIPNGGSLSGNDTTGSFANIPILIDSGIENPVIRINKGLIETITGTADARQAQQPLQTEFKIDSRTPGSTAQYRIRNTTDPIGRIIMRSVTNITGTWTAATAATAGYNRLPNLGNQVAGDIDSFNLNKRRPQSGNATNNLSQGQNHWTPMQAWGNTYTAYTFGTSVPIGTNNYNTGGMEIHINAQARRSSDTNWNNAVSSYEAAYRSVFVFSNMAINGNGTLRDMGQQSQAGATAAPFTNLARTRVYIRGGDKTSGDATVPDFPIGRDRAVANKARLMSPFNIATPANATNGFGPANQNYTTGTITDANIVTTGYNSNGQYMWVWVTWGVNQYAYVDVFAGEMSNNVVTGTTYGHHHVATKDFYGTWTYSKEHYCVIPGRTTIVETRNVYGTQADGGHAADLLLGSVVNSPEPFRVE